jgi:plasmid stabilization system protein ParE
MVYYSEVARQDLKKIIFGLTTWRKHPLGYEHAARYVDELSDKIDMICKMIYHPDAIYDMHKFFGDKVYTYKRNQNTCWYAIYDWNEYDRVAYVQKILNNYLTVS